MYLQARLLSAEYKNLSPEDQAPWQKASVEDKARYDNEMESYVPSEGYSGKYTVVILS